MKVYNLETSLLDSNNQIDEQKLNSVLSEKIEKMKPQSINNKTNNSSVNNLYDIEINGRKYFMKTLLHSQMDDIDREISNMAKINSNKVVKPYILQCKYLVRTNDTIVSIFENVDSMIIKDFISKIHKLDDKEKKLKLQRYLIFALLKAISDLHKVNVCHLKINVNNILVNINQNYDNSETYSTQLPIIVKFINFNLAFNNRKKKYINIQQLDKLDPYFNYSSVQLISLVDAKKYDLWCITLIILKILLPEDVYYKLIKELITGNSINRDDLMIDESFNEVYNNLGKYVLTSLDKRETGDFILNKILLDEKHNY